MKAPIVLLILCSFSILLHAQTPNEPLDWGGGEYTSPPAHPCLTPEQEIDIQKRLDQQREALVQKGILPPRSSFRGQEMVTLFDWPLRQADGFDYFSYYTTVNFVDLDPGNGILDYQCNSRSYNGHKGIDYSLWPFWWNMQYAGQVEVIAAAPGVIINKDDGNFDQNCDCVGNWNAVYIEHSDGSVAYYGHLQENSLTSKAVGQPVVTGEYLGLVGSSGCSSNPHLHLEIHDATNSVIEPYVGNCNSTTNVSWWIDEKPYWEPTLNYLATHDAPPVFDGFCPSDETPNLQNQFYPGEQLITGAYYHDQQINNISSYTIKNPDGTTEYDWIQTSPNTYSRSWWWWSWQIPIGAMEGVWTFNATYFGETFTHEFLVGDVISSSEEIPDHLFSIFPNPMEDFFMINGEDGTNMEYHLYSSNGATLAEGLLQRGTTRIDTRGFPAGIYWLKIHDPQTGRQAYRKVIKSK